MTFIGSSQVTMSFGILPSPNIIRAITCVCASVCGVDMSNPNEPIPSVQPDPRICPQIFSVTCLIDEVVIRGSIRNSPLPLALMLNMMICNRSSYTWPSQYILHRWFLDRHANIPLPRYEYLRLFNALSLLGVL